jgi:hypothetical protein
MKKNSFVYKVESKVQSLRVLIEELSENEFLDNSDKRYAFSEVEQFISVVQEVLSSGVDKVSKIDEILEARENVAQNLGFDVGFAGDFNDVTHSLVAFLRGVQSVLRGVDGFYSDISRAMQEAESNSTYYSDDELEPSFEATILALEGIEDQVANFSDTLDVKYIKRAVEELEEDVNTDLVVRNFRDLSTFLENALNLLDI